MTIFEDAQDRMRAKRGDRLLAAKKKAELDARKYPYATYQGKDPVDGTDIVQVGSSEPVSGFKLISNAPMAIGNRVALRKNNQGGLQRVDDRNRLVTSTEIQEGQTVEFIVDLVFGYDAFGIFTTSAKYSYETPRGLVKTVGNPFNTSVDGSGVTGYTAQSTFQSIIGSVELSEIAPPPIGTVVDATITLTIPNGDLARKIARKVGGESISCTYEDFRNPIAFDSSINGFVVEPLTVNLVTVFISTSNVVVSVQKQDTDIDHTASDNYVLTNIWRFVL